MHLGPPAHCGGSLGSDASRPYLPCSPRNPHTHTHLPGALTVLGAGVNPASQACVLVRGMDNEARPKGVTEHEPHLREREGRGGQWEGAMIVVSVVRRSEERGLSEDLKEMEGRTFQKKEARTKSCLLRAWQEQCRQGGGS